MKIIVTGGAGFIGSHVVDVYLEAGHEVVIVDDLSTGRLDNVNRHAPLQRIDILSPEFEALVRDFRPDVINHHAAQIAVPVSVVNPVEDARRNIMGSLAVFDAARRFGVGKVINVSSGGAIYGEPEVLPCDENHPANPESPYGLSKLTAERYLELYGELHGLRYTTLRYANVYGPRQDPHGEAGVIAIFTDRMLENQRCTIFGSGEQERDFVYVGDLARANLKALDMADGVAVNLGSGVPTSINEVFRVLARATDHHQEPEYAPPKPGEVFRTYLDVTLARDVLDWEPEVSFVDGIEQTVKSYSGG